MSPAQQALETAALLTAWVAHTQLEIKTADGWVPYTPEEMPQIHNPKNWRIKRSPRTFWSIQHSNGVEYITTTDAATAKHWYEDGHSVIVSTELIRQ